MCVCLWQLYWDVISQGRMVFVKIASKKKSKQNGRNDVSGTTLDQSLPWLLTPSVPPGSRPGLSLARGQTDRQRVSQTLRMPTESAPVPVIAEQGELVIKRCSLC